MCQHVTLKSPIRLSLYVYPHVPVLSIKCGKKKGNTWPSGRQAESLRTSSSPPLPPHLASYTRAHTSDPILACTKCIRPKWTRVCYVLLGENTDRRKAGVERTAGPTGICDIMTGGGRPVKIRLHIWSLKLLLSFLEMSLKCKYYK